MLMAVAAISLLTQFYALGSMRRDDGAIRFFTVILFSTFAMFGFVLSTNYFETFFFGALVTVSSYLLIGHWWQRNEAVGAGLRAFVICAIGDLSMLVGVAYIWFRYNELNFQALAGHYGGGKVSANGLFLMALLIFVAAAARSAQFPLHIWLPASVQAPAPAVALIHAATLGVSGVYLVARSYGLFSASPRSLMVVAVVGAVSALLAAAWSLFQANLKQAIAYSTMGELGLMMFALGIGAYSAGAFELFTHAWPKALLFLAAGVVIRELRTERMEEMGGLLPRMRLTGILSLLAIAALAGIPPLSTFWSKDAILSKALATGNPLSVAVIVLAVFLGALSLFRIFALVFLGETARRRRFEPERIRDAGGRVAFALVVLAIPSVLAGVRGPARIDFIAFVTYHGLVLSNSHFTAAIVAALASLLGAAVGLTLYGRRLVPAQSTRLQPAARALQDGFYLDRGYQLAAQRSLLPLGRGLRFIELRVIDAGLSLIADSISFALNPRGGLPRLRPQSFALGLLIGVVSLAALTVLIGARLIKGVG
jgi:NADH-quinone oxidoreductase subunit L